jgi:hypothetical protein
MLNLIGAIYVVQLAADGALTILRFQHAARGLFFVFGATLFVAAKGLAFYVAWAGPQATGG